MPARYSSEGVLGARTPSWLAPGEDSFSCHGALGAGTYSVARVAMNGTSVAAPQATRYYVERWAATGLPPGPGSPLSLKPVSPRVPYDDRLPVAGGGLMILDPPPDKIWKRP